MDLYIDKNNLLSLIAAKEDAQNQEVYEECERLLRRYVHLIYNFDKESCRQDAALLPWLLKRSSAGRGMSEDVDEFRDTKFPERPIKTTFRANMGWRLFMSMFLLEDEKTDALKNMHSMLIGGVGEELQLLNKLFCDSSFNLHSIYNIRDKASFPSWKVLRDDGHIMPCSDIVIADRYLFSNSDVRILEQNLYALLKLFADEKKEQKVNIVFFTDEIDEELRQSVKKTVESFFGKRSGTKVTFVMYNHDRPHDRFILTNYRLFRSGDSFNNYFDVKGNLMTKGLTLDVDSTANTNVCSIVEEIRRWFQSICNNNKEQSRIFGAKESNFIDF